MPLLVTLESERSYKESPNLLFNINTFNKPTDIAWINIICSLTGQCVVLQQWSTDSVRNQQTGQKLWCLTSLGIQGWTTWSDFQSSALTNCESVMYLWWQWAPCEAGSERWPDPAPSDISSRGAGSTTPAAFRHKQTTSSLLKTWILVSF